MFSSLLFLALIITAYYLHQRVKALEEVIKLIKPSDPVPPAVESTDHIAAITDAAAHAVDRHVSEYHTRK